MNESKSNSQGFSSAVIFVIGALLVSSIIFIVNNPDENTTSTANTGKSVEEGILKAPKAPSNAINTLQKQNTQQQQPQQNPQKQQPKSQEIPEERPEEEVEIETPEEIEELSNEPDDEPEEEKEDIPDNNDGPDIRLIKDKIEDETLPRSKPVYLSAEVEDDIGGVDKVEFYINDKKIRTIEKRDANKKENEDKWNSDEAEDATDKAIEHIEEKYNEEDPGYIYREYFEKDGGNCEIEEGYLIIISGRDSYYDVRVTKDADEVDVCYKGKSINYEDFYNYIYTGIKGTHKFHVKAYDIYEEEGTSEKIEFKLE